MRNVKTDCDCRDAVGSLLFGITLFSRYSTAPLNVFFLYFFVGPFFTTGMKPRIYCSSFLRGRRCFLSLIATQSQCAIGRLRAARRRAITLLKVQYPGWCFPLCQNSLVMYYLETSDSHLMYSVSMHAKLYFDWDGQVHFAKGKTRGQ